MVSKIKHSSIWFAWPSTPGRLGSSKSAFLASPPPACKPNEFVLNLSGTGGLWRLGRAQKPTKFWQVYAGQVSGHGTKLNPSAGHFLNVDFGGSCRVFDQGFLGDQVSRRIASVFFWGEAPGHCLV